MSEKWRYFLVGLAIPTAIFIVFVFAVAFPEQRRVAVQLNDLAQTQVAKDKELREAAAQIASLKAGVSGEKRTTEACMVYANALQNLQSQAARVAQHQDGEQGVAVLLDLIQPGLGRLFASVAGAQSR